MTSKNEDPKFFVLPNIGEEIALIEKKPEFSNDEKAKSEAIDKIVDEYNRKTSRIHTVNQLLKAYTMFEKDVEYVVMDKKVKIVDEQTGRILDGRRYSDGLHQAIEAKEGVEIQDATQTYATITLQNYFRMYHKLAGMTGTAETEAGEFWEIYKLDVVVIPTNRPIARKDHEDKVYRTIREKYNAVAQEIQNLVNQGRPVLVGTTSVENSEILSRMLTMRKVEHQVLNAKQHAREAEIVAKAGQPRTVTIATNMAGRGTDIKLTPESKAAGGLAIIGTERHESRRVDRQLRGRSGRQGDPGTSQFFVSMEDNLMRLFIPDSVAKIMDRMGLEEGEVIQHSMITSSIERAQKKVEENNFAIRKRLLEYDDVMNAQRSVIYKRRRNALYGERLSLDIAQMFYATCESLAENNKGNLAGLTEDCYQVFGKKSTLTEEELNKLPTKEAAQKLYAEFSRHYKVKNDAIIEKSLPIVKDIFEKHGEQVEEVFVPFTDGKMRMVLTIDLKKTLESEGRNIIRLKEQMLTLSIIDNIWKEHLRDMDDLRQQVQMATVEQKDPLVVYKFEAFKMFKALLGEINTSVTTFLAKSHIEEQSREEIEARQAEMERLRREQELEQMRLQEQMRINREMEEAEQREKVRELEKIMPRNVVNTPNRNDKVTVRYKDGTVKKNVKYKTVEQDIENNLCVVLE
jgi:preprotein translocase subunit SecA